MEVLQQWNKGLNQDISLSLFQKDTYWNMENMRLVTTHGLSTGVPVNILGNDLSIVIPGTSQQTLITNLVTPDGTIQSLNIVNPNGTFNISFIFDDNWEQNLVNAINNNSTLQIQKVFAAYKIGRVVIWVGLNSNILPYDTISVTGFNPLDFIVSNDNIPAFTDLQIIGWEVIRNEIFLFTTSDTNHGYGQIWKFLYDVTGTIGPSIQLIYNNQLDLSVNFPIANPGGVVGNYENSSIIKLYWTDNNTIPKVINTADPNVQALDPISLDLQSLIHFSLPILQRVIQNGSLLTGIYQYAYRLKQNNGSETTFSQLSSLVPVNSNSEANSSYIKYIGVSSGSNSNKSLEFTINNVDTNFDRIEIVSLYYNNINTTPDIEIIKDEPIPDSGSYTFIHTGTETNIPITLDEFNIITTTILKCKTLASKNNYLFIGNLKESIFDVAWDGRAYRFNTINSIVKSNSGSQIIVNPASSSVYPNQWNIPETYDAINPNQDITTLSLSGSPIGNDPYIYQSDLSTFGGEGPNIKYSFITQKTYLDSQTTNANTDAPSVTVNRLQSSFNFDNFTRVNEGDTFFDFHSPYLDGQLRGYTRGETYRFGIVFFDLQGNQSYTKWIGDIQFPHAYMPDISNPLSSSSKTLQFSPTSFSASGQTTLANNLGIKFEVKNLPQGISGFSITRVQRNLQDKSILGQGLFQVASNQTSNHPTCFNRVFLTDDGIGSSPINNQTSATTHFDGVFGSIFIPEHLFLGNFNFNSNDKLELITRLEPKNIGPRGAYQNAATNQCTLEQNHNLWFIKNYQYSNSMLQDVSIQTSNVYNGFITLFGNYSFEAWSNTSSPVPDAAFNPTPLGEQIYNISVPRDNTDCFKNSYCQGIKTLAVVGNLSRFGNTPGPDRSTTDLISGTANIYLANYKRTPISAYGGNTYSERSQSEYMSCGQYQPVISGLNYTTEVFGGDTFICIFDLMPRKKHFSGGDGFSFSPFQDPTIYQTISPSSGLIRFFPVETTVNIDLRGVNGDINFTCGDGSGSVPSVAVPNKSNFDDWASPGASLFDTQDIFIYNTLYSKENITRVFFPKPTSPISDGVFDTRVRVSQKKINNELIDSWTQFKEADYIDLDTIQGSLTNLMIHQDRLIAFQQKGISVLSVNERSLIEDNSGAELVLGTGGVLTRYDYISKIIGSQHQFGFTQSQDSLFFFDINTKNIYKLSGNSPIALTVSKGLTSYFNNNLNGIIQINDNPYRNKGVTATYDFKYNEALFTFKDTVTDYNVFPNVITHPSFTISFNDFIDAWQSFYSFHPNFYVNDKRNIFSSETGIDLWQHDIFNYGSFYGNIFPSKITMIINPEPSIRKVYDTFQWDSDVLGLNNLNIVNDTFTSVRVYNDNQNSDIQIYPINNITGKIIGRRLEKFWNLSNLRNRVIYPVSGNVDPLNPINISPSDIPYAERMRSPYLFIDLIYNNLNNRRITLNTFMSEFRLSNR